MNVKVTYFKNINSETKFIFSFPELDNYEIAIPIDNNGYALNTDGLYEVVRLLNAANLFRQWNKDRYYNFNQLRLCLEGIAKKYKDSDLSYRFFKFALLGSAEKVADKILVEE